MTLFNRKRFFINNSSPKKKGPLHSIREPEPLIPPAIPPKNPPDEECRVLVINSSHEMAKEITLQLTLQIPGCAITYAPSVELARWILKRREIDLVVSCPILPDGSISKLRDVFESLPQPPDLVVVGDINLKNAEALGDLGYEHLSFRKLGASPHTEKRLKAVPPVTSTAVPKLASSIKSLGADLRNDLNNPLQEIVAMVFVAQATGKSPTTEKALEAIDNAAKNMAKVVSSLEEKILAAVNPYSAAR